MQASLAAILAAVLFAPGCYRGPTGHAFYVGTEHELPDAAHYEALDPVTRQITEPPSLAGNKPLKTLSESRSQIDAPEGRLGVSLYYADTRRRATIVLVHGADAETREMGFIIPYFVLHGVNVISYDQRGTGESTGDWLKAGPPQRAMDVDAVIDYFLSNKRVDSKRIGVWAFSNGGWTAPIIATRRPIAFMILKSASAETVKENLYYEVEQRMLRYHESASSIRDALAAWKTLLGAVFGGERWARARQSFAFAKNQSWFEHSLLSNIHLPMSTSTAQGWKNFMSYDPAATLKKVRVPTLALYGDNDRSVDVHHAARTLEKLFERAGMRDFTLHRFGGASHTLELSRDGFTSDHPVRLAAGYPRIMIDWLRRRGFLTPSKRGR